MSNKGHIRLPAGVRDFLPRAAARRQALSRRLTDLFELWCYERIMTPVFEVAEVLERGLGAEARAAAMRFVEPASGDIVALRPDITPQIARIAATRLGDTVGPLRFYYEGAVTRRQRHTRRQQEILQAGVELIGVGGVNADAEAISLAAAALAHADIADFCLEVGHVALVRDVLASVPEGEPRRDLELALAHKDRARVAEISSGIAPERRRLAEALPTLFGDPEEVLRAASELEVSPEADAALKGLQELLDCLGELVEPELLQRIRIDLGEVQGFDYYTGMRCQGYVGGAGHAVLRGGRYDELIGRYGRPAQATGFALDIEALAEAQYASGVAGAVAASGVLVTGDAASMHRAARLAAALRGAGFRAAVHLGGEEGDDVATYASERGFSRVLLLLADGGCSCSGVTVETAVVTAAIEGNVEPLLGSLVEE